MRSKRCILNTSQTRATRTRSPHEPRTIPELFMPLDKFIAEVMAILESQPNATEICVENVKGLRPQKATAMTPFSTA